MTDMICLIILVEIYERRYDIFEPCHCKREPTASKSDPWPLRDRMRNFSARLYQFRAFCSCMNYELETNAF